MSIPQTTAFIDLDAIRHNYNAVRNAVGEDVRIMAIVKSNAYGHGVKHICAELVESGADWFGVARLGEAIELRRCGVVKPILILGYTEPDLAKVLSAERLTQAVFSSEYAEKLNSEAEKAGVRVDCHLKIDTGMTRLGFSGASAAEIAGKAEGVLTLNNLEFTGIFTHFAVADEPAEQSREFTLMQGNLFKETVEILKSRGHEFSLVHACNSAGTLYYPQFHFDMVRPGIVLYGYSPLGEPDSRLIPAMELKSVVESVKQVPPGASVSYGREYIAEDTLSVAAVGIGYADGIHRSVAEKGMVWLNGSIAPMIGRICMDQLMVDVTGIEAECGDEVTIFGGDSPITADNLAALCGTCSYECLCAVSRRVPRVYVKGGGIVATIEYSRT